MEILWTTLIGAGLMAFGLLLIKWLIDSSDKLWKMDHHDDPKEKEEE